MGVEKNVIYVTAIVYNHELEGEEDQRTTTRRKGSEEGRN